MKNQTSTNPTQPTQAAKPGLIKRMVQKLDASMKAKADKKAGQGCCCNSGSDKDKGDKCC